VQERNFNSSMTNIDPNSCVDIFNKHSYGETYDWFSTDTEECFKEAKEAWGDGLPWEGDSITYRINSHGFRGDDLHPVDSDSFIALGCSFTFGVGVKEEQTWPSVLSESLGMHGYNLGAAAHGVETMFRVLDYWLPRLRSKHVFLLVNPGVRREFFNADKSPNRFHTLSAWSSEYDFHSFDAHRFLHEREAYISKRRALYAIKGLCDASNVTLDILETDEGEVIDGLTRHFDETNFKNDRGRDTMHPGPKYNVQVSRDFERTFKQYK